MSVSKMESRLVKRVSIVSVFLALLWSVAPASAADTASPPQNAPDVKDSSGGADLSLSLARVTLDAETGKYDEAFDLINRLNETYADDTQVMLSEADLNFRIGNNARGFAILNNAANLDPDNQDIANRLQAENLAQGAFSSVGYNFRRTTEAYDQFMNFNGHLDLSPSVKAGLLVENDHLNTRIPLYMANGTLQGFYGNRQNVTIDVDKSFENSDEATASLFGTERTAGGGALYRFWDHNGATSVAGNVFRPFWDYPETVIQYGTKSDAHIERKQIFTPNLQATLSGGYNHYDLRGDDDAASSLGWNFDLGYTLPYAFSPERDGSLTFGANYTADSEYFTHVDRRVANGVHYHPLPAHSYEVHALNLSATKQLLENLTAEVFGGYAVDRITTNNGPLYGVEVNYSPAKNLSVGLHGSHTRLGGPNNNEKTDIVSLQVKWTW